MQCNADAMRLGPIRDNTDISGRHVAAEFPGKRLAATIGGLPASILSDLLTSS
jgi:hypothetical protein